MDNKKIKAIHIHTDYKFIRCSYDFDGELFENQTIILQNNEPFNGTFKHKAILLGTSISDVKKAINICKSSDLVVLYDLNSIKCQIALAVPANVKVAWRFFGYELYERKKELFLSEKTLKFYLNRRENNKNLLLNFFYYLKRKCNKKYKCNFSKAVKRINYMLVLSNEEYSFLKNEWETLPEFIQIPRGFFSNSLKLPDKTKGLTSKPIIVVGNNRNLFNNHIDVIDLINNNPARSNYNFTLLFNYGPTGSYYHEIKDRVKNKPYFTLVEDFIAPEKFNDFYQDISALVINSYRQMAGANILLALRNGTKVYLNDKNVHMQWLKNEGFSVFSLAELDEDLKNGNVQLDRNTAEKNLKQLEKLPQKYAIDNFQRELYSKIVNSKV